MGLFELMWLCIHIYSKFINSRYWEWICCHPRNSPFVNGASAANVDALELKEVIQKVKNIRAQKVSNANASLFSSGDSKIVKKDGESVSMDTAPAEAPAAPTEPSAANGNCLLNFSFI